MSSEHPIIFSGPMVRALLAGTKTQTRRLVRLGSMAAEPDSDFEPGERWGYTRIGQRDDGAWRVWMTEYPEEGSVTVRCPYGQPGDRLWVREKWAAGACSEGLRPNCLSPAFYWGLRSDNTGLWYSADAAEPLHPVTPRGKWRPSIHMPRWASRLTLEVTEVRAQRLQSITEADARAEGFSSESMPARVNCKPGTVAFFDPRHWFAVLWDSINSKRAPWIENPWVWVISFAVVQARASELPKVSVGQPTQATVGRR
jgi:hypothetical protein